MTIQLLQHFNGLAPGVYRNLGPTEESRLIGLGLARDWYDGIDGGRSVTATSKAAEQVNSIPSFAYRTQVFDRQGQVSEGNFPISGRAWEATIYGPKVIKSASGTFYMYYAGYDSNYLAYRVCLATSTDLVTWTKPNLGRFTYGGNTNNNIVYAVDGIKIQLCGIVIDPISGDYIMSVRNDNTGPNLLLRSSDGGVTVPFAWITGASPGVGECADLTFDPRTSKYRWWYRANGPSARSIGFLDSAALGGPWIDRGYRPQFVAVSTYEQFYDISIFYRGGRMFGVLNMFSDPDQILSPLRCYVSDDHGDTWTRQMDLLQRPEAGQWDRGLVTDACPILHNGTWYLFYGGKTQLHDVLGPITLGLATARI